MEKKLTLTLQRETLRVLTDDDLAAVWGGSAQVPTATRGCPSNSDDFDDPTSPIADTTQCVNPSDPC